MGVMGASAIFLPAIFSSLFAFIIAGIVVTVFMILFLAAGYSDEDRIEEYYDNHLIVPFMHEVLPEIEYRREEDLADADVRQVIPQTEIISRDHMIFKDPYGTEYANACAYHSIEVRNAEGTPKTKTVRDFYGGVIKARMRYTFYGEIYIVPIGEKEPERKERKKLYNVSEKGHELKLGTDSDSFRIYTTNVLQAEEIITDVLYSRLNDLEKRVPFSAFMSGNTLCIGVNSGKWIFDVPETVQEINELSAMTLYRQLDYQLNEMYEIVKCFLEQ